MKTEAAVIDASYVMSWLLPDEERPTNKPGVRHATELLVFEVINSLRSAVASSRITAKFAGQLLSEFEGWSVQYHRVSASDILSTAIKYKISGYDASYVWLAKNIKLPLLTWDAQLKGLVRV